MKLTRTIGSAIIVPAVLLLGASAAAAAYDARAGYIGVNPKSTLRPDNSRDLRGGNTSGFEVNRLYGYATKGQNSPATCRAFIDMTLAPDNLLVEFAWKYDGVGKNAYGNKGVAAEQRYPRGIFGTDPTTTLAYCSISGR